MAVRLEVFDQWWASLAEVASDHVPAAGPNEPLRAAGGDLVGRRDRLAGRWTNLRDQAWDEW